MDWPKLAGWWLNEIRTDPTYEAVVTPLLIEVLQPEVGNLLLDLGCGEGRVMRTLRDLGAEVHGIDLSLELIERMSQVVVACLPHIPMRNASYDGVYAVLTLEHIPDHRALFSQTALVTKQGGVLALVINHPTWTAPGSTPITDVDGEILWRPGLYFDEGFSDIPVAEGTVTFHHRSMASLLNAAANAGWALEQMLEEPHHELAGQEGIPRLLACRWSRQ